MLSQPPVFTVPDDVWAFLEHVALHPQSPEPGVAGELVKGTQFDHGRMVENAMRHGLLPSVADFLHRHELRRSLPVRLRNPVLAALHHSRQRSRVLTQSAVYLDGALAQAEIPVVWTKGVVLQSWLYGSAGIRLFNDIDMMILPEHRADAREALIAAGYVAEHRFDPSSGALSPIDRATARLYQLSPDHLPHFHRLTGDAAVPVVAVDVANSLTWHGSSWEVPVQVVHRAARRVAVMEGTELPAMAPHHTLLFLALHLFREGWFERTIRTKDLSLAQFADVSLAWRRLDSSDRQELAMLISEYQLEEPIGWVTAHTDSIFGDSMTETLGLSEVATPSWISSARGRTGAILHWTGTMRERLRASGPLELVEGGRP